MRIGKEIALEAKKKGICQEWYKKMLNISTFSDLAAMYYKGDDWAMENDFPSVEMMRKFKGSVFPFGLIVDDKGSYDNVKDLAIFGHSDTILNYDTYAVGKVNVRHNSKVVITLCENAFVIVNVLDHAEVQIDCKDDSKALVYYYGENTKINTTGNVEVKKSSWAK